LFLIPLYRSAGPPSPARERQPPSFTICFSARAAACLGPAAGWGCRATKSERPFSSKRNGSVATRRVLL
jgi:hypothetical protein